jgi:hypothetical protein
LSEYLLSFTDVLSDAPCKIANNNGINALAKKTENRKVK